MPEESSSSESVANRETLERRLDRLEQEYLRENRWWRGGLIGALVLIAVAILVNGLHHRRPQQMGSGPMAMQGPVIPGPYGMTGPMGYPPPPPPNWGYGYGYGPGPGWCHRGCPGDWRGRSWGGPGGTGGSGTDGGSGAGSGGPPPHPSDG